MQFLLPLEPATKTVDWEQARATDISQEQLLQEPPQPGDYQPLPLAATKTLAFTRWAKQFDRWLARTQRVTLMLTRESGETVRIEAGEPCRIAFTPAIERQLAPWLG